MMPRVVLTPLKVNGEHVPSGTSGLSAPVVSLRANVLISLMEELHSSVISDRAHEKEPWRSGRRL